MNPLDENGEKRDLYFDTDCIKLINDNWNLDRKAIYVIARNMYFSALDDLYPLKNAYKRGSSGSKWKQAYQAMKHDRYKSLKKGTLKNLLEALGALYILNVYYANDSYYAGQLGDTPAKIEGAYSSQVFEAYYADATEIEWNNEMGDEQILWKEGACSLEKSIYVVRIGEDNYRRQHSEWSYVQRKREILFSNNKSIKRFLKAHPDSTNLSLEEICILAGGLRLANEIMGKREIDWFERPLIQVVVNMNKTIYPSLEKIDVHNIDEVLADEFSYQPENNWWTSI